METESKAMSPLRIILIGLLVLLIGAIIILACVPPVSKDALVHHLAVPKLYIEQGRIYEIPTLLFSYYPMNVELLYLIPLALGNDIIPKYIHFLFALLTAWLLFRYLKRRLDTTYALFGAVLFLSIPIIVKLSITAYVDLGLVFFSTASLVLVLTWLERDFRIRYLIMAAICCGLGMGTKYNGIITMVLLTLFIPFLRSRYERGQRPAFIRCAGNGLMFMGIALVLFSPWMIRNYLWTHNPVFPQYDWIFNPHNPLVRNVPDIFTFRGELYGETWWHILLLPVRIFFQGQDGSPRFFDGVLNPFLLFLPGLAFVLLQKDPRIIQGEKKILLAFSILFLLMAFFTRDIRIRYLTPILPPLVILSVFGVRRLMEMIAERSPLRARTGRSLVVLVLAGITLGLNGSYVIGQFHSVAPFPYLTGRVDRDQYISTYRLEYPAMRFINEHLPHDARILFFFIGKRGYYCDRDYVLDMKDYRGTHSILREAVERSATPEDLLAKLHQLGITHLLINHPIFDEWAHSNLKLGDYEKLRAFFKRYADLQWYENDHGLSRLKTLSDIEPTPQGQ